MMTTPICDFVRRYQDKHTVRLHMPGHKGKRILGAEPLDITEIGGADELYHASGIICESEQNAARLFGSAKTFYSTEGSSLSIRAMLLLVRRLAAHRGETPRVLACRNAHKSFLSAIALLDIETEWLFSKDLSLLSCKIDLAECETLLKEKRFTALYVTSPDYLGNLADIEGLSALCHKYGTLLVVDNAHGAYLKFLPKPCHPLDMGADLVCDSAHKTLPVLTGGGYLHISKNAPTVLLDEAENALSLFASTSPSYLILQSLDYANLLLEERIPKALAALGARADTLKASLEGHGYTLVGDESTKLTIWAKPYGYRGDELAAHLEERNVVCEFCDPDFLVLMLSPETSEKDIDALEEALIAIPQRPPLTDAPPKMVRPTVAMSPRTAMLAKSELTEIENAVGKVLADPSVSCPPAVPILVSGERIDREAANCFAYYGISKCRTVKE